jgi:type IV secretion system protein VirB10
VTPTTSLVESPPAPAAPTPARAVDNYVVANGTHLPLRLLNSVSTKHSAPGDHVYLETIYPILSKGRVIIPPGSYVEGSLSEVKRAGRIKGKSELYLRFDSLTLPNGVTRDFRARLGADENNSVDRKEGKVVGDSGKGQDAKTIAEATAAGTGIGVLAGSAAGHLGMGAGIGAAAGALGGLAGVLATRGPDAVLQKGSTVEMILDRDLVFAPDEVPSRPSVR